MNSKSWAVVRLGLGTLQIVGATTGAILLLRSGVNTVSVGAAVITGIVTLTSLLLFREKKQ
jgi:hypothetical protein